MWSYGHSFYLPAFCLRVYPGEYSMCTGENRLLGFGRFVQGESPVHIYSSLLLNTSFSAVISLLIYLLDASKEDNISNDDNKILSILLLLYFFWCITSVYLSNFISCDWVTCFLCLFLVWCRQLLFYPLLLNQSSVCNSGICPLVASCSEKVQNL